MLNNLICKLIGHKYFVTQVFNIGCRKVGCSRCGKYWGMHDRTKSFIEWDSDLEEFHAAQEGNG